MSGTAKAAAMTSSMQNRRIFTLCQVPLSSRLNEPITLAPGLSSIAESI
jgi:hypothetical protein